MLLVDGIAVWGEHEDNTIEQAKVCARDASYMALMADGHLGYGVPIGGVVAYENAISPTAVGYDISCGNKAVLTDMSGVELRANIGKIMDDVWDTIAFGVGRKGNEHATHPLFDYHEGWSTEAAAPLKQKAASQFSSVGSGNHYVDLFTDELDRVWVGVHFGSRGLGHGIATWFLKKTGAKDDMNAVPVVIQADSDLGQQYIAASKLAGDYAYGARDWVCARVAKLLGASILDEVHNNHNDAKLENHGGRDLWVCRKGSTPARPGQRGFVGGSMGENSVILEGVESPEGPLSLYSTVHGAGRRMGRKEAVGTFDKKTGAVKRPGKVTQAMMDEWLQKAGVTLRGAGLDESPDCYRRLPDVLGAHSASIRILHTLKPVGVAMAGANEFDPYRD